MMLQKISISKQMLFLLTFYSPKNTDLFKNVSFATFCIAFHKKKTYFYQINAALMSIRDFFQKHYKILLTPYPIYICIWQMTDK